MIEAKLKSGYRFNKIILFSGYEYVKDIWRPIPRGMEQEAIRPEYFLDLRDVGKVEVALPAEEGRIAEPEPEEVSAEVPVIESELPELPEPPKNTAPRMPMFGKGKGGKK